MTEGCSERVVEGCKGGATEGCSGRGVEGCKEGAEGMGGVVKAEGCVGL